MTRPRKPYYRKKRFYLLILSTAFLIFVYNFSQFRTSDSKFEQLFSENGYEDFGIDRVAIGTSMMRYVWAGSDDKPVLLMIHGSPSSSSFWKAFFEDEQLKSNYKLVAVDRPGFGYSNFGKLLPDIKKQSDLVAAVISEVETGKGNYVLASSYGGPVAASLAMENNDRIDGIVFQSSSLIPEKEKTYDFTFWTRPKWIAALLPTTIRMANDEKWSHARELAKIQKGWDKIRAHIIFLHGSDDGLIYPKNATIAKELAVNAESSEIKFFEGRGHDLYWTERDALKSVLLNLKEKKLAFIGRYEENRKQILSPLQ